MFAFAVISIEVWDTEFPVWGLILALIICKSFSLLAWSVITTVPLLAFVYAIPCGMIQAITNQQIALK